MNSADKTRVRFRLTEKPASAVDVYVTFEQNFPALHNGDGFLYEASSSTKSFTPGNFAKYHKTYPLH